MPVVVAENLTETQIRAYRLLDNKIGEQAKWNEELLCLELGDMSGVDWSSFSIEWAPLGGLEIEPPKEVEAPEHGDSRATTCPNCGYEFES